MSTDQLEVNALDTARALEEARASLLQLAWTGARNRLAGVWMWSCSGALEAFEPRLRALTQAIATCTGE